MSKELTKKERESIERAVTRAIGGKDATAVNDALLKTILFRITHPPKKQTRWDGVRWLLSEMAQFALRDFER